MVKITAKQQQRINNTMRLLDTSFNIKYNVIKLNVGNTLQHELAKCKKAYELIKAGNVIITEAVFKGGCRADILDLLNMRVFEILASESEEECLKKVEKYPCELEVVNVEASKVLKQFLREVKK